MSEVPHWKLKATCSRREVGMVLQQDRALHMVLVIFQELGVDVLELSVFQHCFSVRKRLELMTCRLQNLVGEGISSGVLLETGEDEVF